MSKGKIVIADDNQEVCDLIQEALTPHGYHVDAVNDGYQLLSYLEGNNPALVILDLVMPEKGGLSIFDTIKRISPNSHVVIYTGFGEYEDSVFARKADRFILKGASIEGLIDAVKELA